MRQAKDLEEVLDLVKNHPDYFTFDAVAWFNKPENVTLVEGGNIAFAEYKALGIYWVHFCFNTAKGRKAVTLTEKIFEEFCKLKPVKIVYGTVAVENRAAKWVVRQAGFKSLGEMHTGDFLCEMFYKINKDL